MNICIGSNEIYILVCYEVDNKYICNFGSFDSCKEWLNIFQNNNISSHFAYNNTLFGKCPNFVHFVYRLQ